MKFLVRLKKMVNCTTTYQKLYSVALATSGLVGELEKPISIECFNVSVPTPSGMERASHIVRKMAPAIKMRISLCDKTTLTEVELICAEEHLIGVPCNPAVAWCEWKFAKELKVHDKIRHIGGEAILLSSENVGMLELFDIQVQAAHHCYYDGNGLLHHNTLMVAGMCDLLQLDGYRTIVVVPSSDLVDQTSATFKLAGIEHGIYSGSKKDLSGNCVIATWQALQNNPQIMGDFQCVIVDEAHGAAAKTIGELITEHGKHIGYRFGFTGTLPKAKTDQYTLRGSLGEVLYTISAGDLISMGFLANLEIEPIELQEKAEEDFPDYGAEKAYTSRSPERLDFLADLIIDRATRFGNTLVLVNTIKQGQQLQKLIKDSVFLQGATENDVRAEWYSTFESRDDLIVIATVGIAAVGISIDRIFALFLIDAGKSFIKCIQSIGRGLRKGRDKDFVHVFDVYSSLKWGKKHARERARFYKAATYKTTKVLKAKL